MYQIVVIDAMKSNKSLLGQRYDYPEFSQSARLHSSKEGARNEILKLLEQCEPESIACLCGEHQEKHIEVLATIDRWGLPVRTGLCKSCGLVRIEPRHNSSIYESIYKNIYWELSHGAKDLTEKRFLLSVKRAKPFADHLINNYKFAGKKLLEIGASYGAGLYRLKDEDCKKLVGYDYDKEFLKKGREYTGLDLRYGGVDEALIDKDKYDLVILRHVFEHFLKPSRELSSLSELLEEDGMLFIEVPGVFTVSFWYDDLLEYFDFFHPYSYTLSTLKNEMSKSGYVLHKADEHIYSFWHYKGNSLEIDPAINEASRVKNHLQHIERKRARRESFYSALPVKVILKFAYFGRTFQNWLFKKN